MRLIAKCPYCEQEVNIGRKKHRTREAYIINNDIQKELTHKTCNQTIIIHIDDIDAVQGYTAIIVMCIMVPLAVVNFVAFPSIGIPAHLISFGSCFFIANYIYNSESNSARIFNRTYIDVERKKALEIKRNAHHWERVKERSKM